ncbi:MAG: hypothetical protein DME23_27000 [Verrucomicrobia bacterium]|nr:MAG: hypothetical protein DME23_27000 [Verrucomicrobiota bacterium]
MSTDVRQNTSEAAVSRKTGRWITLGLVVIVFADTLIMLEDSSTEFWPRAIVFAAFVTAMSMAFVLPGYLAFSGIAVMILNRTRLSEAARKRWLLGPPLIVLIGVLLSLANHARPSVAIRRIIPR